ncbi:MAG: hypothetical protein K1X57_11085 [Gemmataceae bacterium]|nr:hypothetical protein [Gemmataceae bacterium]
MLLAELTLTFDPAPPWNGAAGPVALGVVAILLASLTVYTYRGSGVPGRRVGVVVALRLLALLLAVLTVLRPSFAVQEPDTSPSVLLVALDCSKSMTVADEIDNKSRFVTAERLLKRCADQFDGLRDKFQIATKFYRFSDDVFEDERGPDGPRTDFGVMLRTLAQRHGQERALRGLIVLSDGGDNGVRYPALTEAARFRALNCPVETFALGKQNTSNQQRDIAVTGLVADPSPVPVKQKVTFRVAIDAPGFENTRTTVRLFLDGRPAGTQDVTLTKSVGNDVALEATAPSTPGEVKVTVRVDSRPGEASVANNELTTYLTITKEGISVLVVDRLRLELKFLRRALAGDPRFRVYEAIRQTDDPPRGNAAELYNFDRQAYDVILIGDVSARRFSGGRPAVLQQLEDLVRVRGTGLAMLGGLDSFAPGGWANTPVAPALPVGLETGGQSEDPVQLLPSPGARGEFLMRLLPDAAANDALWKKLPPLPGSSLFGRRKDGATVVGQSANGTPLYVRQFYGNGRTVALGVDMTFLWQQLGQQARPRTNEGIDAHTRFWRQMVLWLAKQEETEGSVWIKPDVRRVAAGSKLNFNVGVRGKSGLELPAAVYEVSAIAPEGPVPGNLPITRTADLNRGAFWKTDTPGEYSLKVKAKATDADGAAVEGEAMARFIVYQDDTELLRPAADHDLLTRVAQSGGGRFHLADELPKFLEELPMQASAGSPPKTRYYPDWRGAKLGWFQPTLFGLFAALLCGEWALRRWWGMV